MGLGTHQIKLKRVSSPDYTTPPTDFPDAEVKLAMCDLAKAISITMFELTLALRDDPSLLDAAMEISKAVASSQPSVLRIAG